MILFREPSDLDPSNLTELEGKSLNDDSSTRASIKAREGTSVFYFLVLLAITANNQLLLR